MVDSTVFVAIAIACVIILLLITLFFIYCIKRQHDKRERETQMRREREMERYRRRAMRARVVLPPAYDNHTQDVSPVNHGPIPFTPPPAYKEVATPLPRNRTNEHMVGIGGAVDRRPTHAIYHNPTEIPTVTRNVAPSGTLYNEYNYSQQAPSLGADTLAAIPTNSHSTPRSVRDPPPSYSSHGSRPPRDPNSRLADVSNRHGVSLISSRQPTVGVSGDQGGMRPVNTNLVVVGEASTSGHALNRNAGTSNGLRTPQGYTPQTTGQNLYGGGALPSHGYEDLSLI